MERTDLDQWRARDVARLLALVETQRRYYQEMVASIPVGLMVLSADLVILLANGAARRIFGLHPGESPRRRMDTILPTSLLDRIEEVLRTGVAENGVMIETSRDKRRLRVGIVAIRNWDEEAAQEALLTIEDLTTVGLMLAPAPVVEAPIEAPSAPPPAVAASEFVDNLDAVIWAVELPSMNFVFASPQAGKLLGFPPEHWTSHPSFWLDRIHDSDRDWVAQSYQRAIDSGTAHACEFQAITAGGGPLWLREYSRLLPAAEGQPRYLIGVAVDVTERRMLEDQLVQAERVEAVSRLASRMAHDLNNTLMILTGYSEELLTALPAGSTMRSDVQEILTATERVGGLTSQLLSFARRQGQAAGEMELESALSKISLRLDRAARNARRPGPASVRGTEPRPRRCVAIGARAHRHRRARSARHARRRKNHAADLASGSHGGFAAIHSSAPARSIRCDLDHRAGAASGCRSQSRAVRVLAPGQGTLGRRRGHAVPRLWHGAAMGRRYLGLECSARFAVPHLPAASGRARRRCRRARAGRRRAATPRARTSGAACDHPGCRG